jgi:hypothetical protein
MNTAADSAPHDRFSLARVLILVLAGAFAFLMADIRVEHVEAVHDHTLAWVPIIYSAVMAVACLAAFIVWNKTTRLVMSLLFLLAFVVGGLGFYLHNHGNLRDVLKSSVTAWTDPNMDHPDGPPQVAPLAFAGIGLIGLLASLKRFNPR